jgi:hypothetical protein
VIDWQAVIALVLIPAVPSLLVQAINVVWIGLFKQPKPSTSATRWLVYGAAIGVTLLQTQVALPPTSEPSIFIPAVLALAVAVTQGAQLFYDKFLQPVLGGIDALVFKASRLGFLAPKRTP